jgi:two-component system, chemotaxis family, response regulator Rcp1
MLPRMAEILVVEDNPADVTLLREAMRNCQVPHRLRVVADGTSAIELLDSCSRRSWCPDLVLLDLNLPGRSGYDVLKAIRSNEVTASVPVIVLSSSQDQADVDRAYDAYANCYIVKPSEIDSLFDVANAIESFWLSVAELPTR